MFLHLYGRSAGQEFAVQNSPTSGEQLEPNHWEDKGTDARELPSIERLNKITAAFCFECDEFA